MSAPDLDILNQENLESLLNSYLDQEEPDFVRIRWIFRRLAQVGAPGAVPLAIRNFDQFTPALADLGSYLLSAGDNIEGDWSEIGEEVLRAFQLPTIQKNEYLKMTLLDFYARVLSLDHVGRLIQMYNTSSPEVRRKIVRAATAMKADYWLHELKETFSNADPWLRRALVAAASTFGKDERDAWFKHIENKTTQLEKWIMKWAK